MPKSVNYGGQKRTTIAPCGFVAKGAPREANFKTRLHFKVCAICKEIAPPDPNLTPFNNVIANQNGWNGLNGSEVIREKQAAMVFFDKENNLVETGASVANDGTIFVKTIDTEDD